MPPQQPEAKSRRRNVGDRHGGDGQLRPELPGARAGSSRLPIPKPLTEAMAPATTATATATIIQKKIISA